MADKSKEPQAKADVPQRKSALTYEFPEEFGGKDRPEPTRYGDWEMNGKCVDF